jgi:serine protease Do
MEWKNTFGKFRHVLVGVLATTVLLGGYAYSQKFTTTNGADTAVAPQVSSATPPSQGMVLADFSQIAAEQGPAVVNVSVTGSVKTALHGFPGFGQVNPDDPFGEFFRRFQVPMPQGSVPTHGQGSGFIVSADGVVLTNAHVVADADEVTVKLTDKREFKAKVVGVDKLSDVAVLRINAKGLPTVHIGEPKNSRVGEWVVAIGSPFGFENTVTAGIVSAKSRTLPDEGYVPFLQTDVAINPGNSGGPLFNLRGEVIGINSQIYSSNGGYQGLSFAIPIDVAMKVERQLLDTGKVSRGRLGISVQDVSAQVAESLGMDKSKGALVGAVERGSPADQAGIEPGDVVVQFAGTAINRSGELPPLVSDVTPGSKVVVTVLRRGKTQELTVTVGEMKSLQAKGRLSTDESARLGLAVRPLTDKERKEAGVVGGLMVEEVRAGLAQAAGIQTGDVILSANGELLVSVEQLQSKVDKSGKNLAVLVLRDDSQLYIPIHLG